MVSHLYFVAALVLFTYVVSAQKYVFAHVAVSNTVAHTLSTWQNDIALANYAGVDAFALNCGYPDSTFPTQVANAFAAAAALEFNFQTDFLLRLPWWCTAMACRYSCFVLE